MTPGTYNITARQGSTLSLTFGLKDGAGTAIDLTAATPRMQVRTTALSPEIALDCTPFLSVADPLTGVITLEVTAEAMGDVAAGVYVYDLDVQAGSKTDTWLAGTFTVQAEVTR